MTTTPTAAARVSGTIKARADLIRDALRFAYLAAGEGIEIDGLAPEDFLMAYSDATGDEEWDTFADRLAAIQPDPEPQQVACPECGDTGMRDTGGVHLWGEHISVPCDCTPSSAGTVSVGAAFARLPLLAALSLVEQSFKDGIAAASIIEITDPDDAWQRSKARATLRALAGEGER